MVVTTATVEHADVMVCAVNAGKHVFAEKLLGVNLDEVDTIVAAARQAGVALTVALPRLSEHYTRTIDRVLSAHRYGELTYARVRLAHDGSIKDWLPKRFYDPGEAAGGAFTDLGLPSRLSPGPFLRPDSRSRSRLSYGQMTGRGVDDNSVVTFRYDDGAIGVAETGFVSPGHSPFTIELHWNRASLFYGYSGDGFQLWEDGERLGEPEPTDQDGPTPFEQFVEHAASGSLDEANLTRPEGSRIWCRWPTTAPRQAAPSRVRTTEHPEESEGDMMTTQLRVGIIGAGGIAGLRPTPTRRSPKRWRSPGSAAQRQAAETRAGDTARRCTATTTRCWPRTSTPSTSACRTTCTRTPSSRRPRRQARPVREAPLPHR